MKQIKVIVGLRSGERNTGVFGQQQCVGSELRLTAEAHQTHNQEPP